MSLHLPLSIPTILVVNFACAIKGLFVVLDSAGLQSGKALMIESNVAALADKLTKNKI